VASIHNELRKYTALLRAFKDAMGSTDQQFGVERFGETLQPIIDMWRREDWSALFGEQLIWDTINSPINGVLNSWAAVFSPAGSGLIMTIDAWAVQSNANTLQAGSLAQATVAAGTLGNADARDRRYGSSSVSPARTSFGAGALLLAASWQPLLNNIIYPVPVVLTPGSNFAVQETTISIGVNLSFMGRVRRGFPEELKPRSF